MADSWFFIVIVLAIFIGWLLGRRSASTGNSPVVRPSQYYQGLNYLLNDQRDGALDSFIEGLEVNSETLETHIAVGNLMRKKGEVDRAIRIHQNLLSRPSLPRVHLHQAHLELARDYISAGLLDRAERLLKDLIAESAESGAVAMRHLLEIYQAEKEWQQAIDTAQKLLPRRFFLKSSQPADDALMVALAHYCCEMAEQSLVRNDYHQARTQLKQAISYDKNCVRASLLLAEIEFLTGHYSHCLKTLRKVQHQDPVFLPETTPLFKKCFAKMGREDAFQDEMQQHLQLYPSTSIVLAVVADLQARDGDEAAAKFIGDALKRRPSLKGLAKLVNLHIANSGGQAKENLTILQELIEQLVRDKPQYQCHHCGFSGKRLHWLCPSCKTWGQVKAIRGAEGD